MSLNSVIITVEQISVCSNVFTEDIHKIFSCWIHLQEDNTYMQRCILDHAKYQWQSLFASIVKGLWMLTLPVLCISESCIELKKLS